MRRLALAVAVLALAGCRQVLGIPGDFTGDGIPVAGMVRGADGATAAMVYLAIDGVPVDSVAVTVDGPLDLRATGTGSYAVTADPTCTVAGGAGTLTEDGVDDVVVTCDGLSALRALGLTSPVGLSPEFSPAVQTYDLAASRLTQLTWMRPTLVYPDAVLDGIRLDGGGVTLGPAGHGPMELFTAAELELDVSHADALPHAYTVFVNPVEVAEFGYGKSADSEAGVWFGAAVALDRDVAVVGAPEAAGQAGRAYVFRRTGETWIEEAALVASDTAAGARFGESVSVMGNVIAIGAPGANGGAGAAYLYRNPGDQWIETRVSAAGGAAQDRFGAAVAVADGNQEVVVIGAPGEDGGGVDAGGAYVFENGASTWELRRHLLAPSPDPGAAFGASVVADPFPGWVIVGAPFEDGPAALNEPGAVYAFAPPDWTTATLVVPDVRHAGDHFGAAVALDATLLVVGAPQADVAGDRVGLAYLFAGPSFAQTALITAANPDDLDGFGTTVAIARDIIAIGAPQEDSSGAPANNAASAAGAVYVYDIVGAGAVGAPVYLKASNVEAGDQFGAGLGLTIDALVVGAPFEDSGTDGWSRASDGANNMRAQAGAVYAFR